MTGLCKHPEIVAGCKACHLWATSDTYRAAVAKLRSQPPPPLVNPDRKPAAVRPMIPPVGHGPGTELKKMTATMGVPACHSCSNYAEKLDRWDVEGCREHFEEIVAHLEKESQRLGWFKWAAAGVKAVTHGLPTTARGLVDEAIRRASLAPSKPPAS